MTTPDHPSLSRQMQIINELGLHARSAAKVAQLAREAAGPIWLIRDDERVDARQVLDILTLGAFQGTMVTIEIEDPADTAILEQVAQLFADGFGE